MTAINLDRVARSKRQINRALAAAGLAVEIQNNRDGYSYFTGLGGSRHGHQIGDSVFVCYLSSYTVGEWVAAAQIAIGEGVRL